MITTPTDSLEQVCREVRIDVLEMLKRAGSGHPGGSLSCVEIIATLYTELMNVDPARPDWIDRDRFILSKGHASATLYAVLSRRGFFPKDELVANFREINSRFQAHPDMKKTPGIDASTGSLGQGLSVANGLALGLRLRSSPAYVYTLLGDGECQEGQVWEAAMTAAHFGLSRVIAFVDNNKVQLDGCTDDIMSLQDLDAHWRSLNWHVQTIDGHDPAQVKEAVFRARDEEHKPSVIIAETVKGKGVPFMEGKSEYHGKVPASEELEREIVRLKEGLSE